LNSAVAAQLIDFKSEVDAKIAAGSTKEKAIFDVIKSYIKASKAIRFDGNGYSEEWKVEAGKRGLDCETSVPKIIEAYTSASSVELFTKLGVLSEKELHARNEVKWETYVKKIQIEARVLGDLAINHIIPVATRYQSLLLDNVYKVKAVFSADKAEKISSKDMALIEEISERISTIKDNVDALVDARKVANTIEHEDKKALAYHDDVLPYFDLIRYEIDKLELIVDDEMWTLPKYRELLFIR
jgi:glutamine synthetase